MSPLSERLAMHLRGSRRLFNQMQTRMKLQ